MEQRFQTSEGHSLLPYLSWNKIRCARTLCVRRNILESRPFPISLTPHLHSGGEGPKSWLAGLEGETVLTSPTCSLGRAAFASNALRFPEPWGNIEVKVLSSWRSAVVQSCPWLMGSISQILRHSSTPWLLDTSSPTLTTQMTVLFSICFILGGVLVSIGSEYRLFNQALFWWPPVWAPNHLAMPFWLHFV